MKLFLFICLVATWCIPGIAQTNSPSLNYQTKSGLKVNVHKQIISVNGKNLYKCKFDDIIYASKRNRLVEDDGSTFLFLEVNGSPNLDRLYVFKITNDKVDSVADSISSDLRDLDGDGKLEFGGRDLTESHPSEDSMYYIPSDYYEIRNGKILYDSAFTEEIDLRINGISLRYSKYFPLNCCDVVVKPGKAKIDHFPLVHPLILSERTDGPANVRDTIGGKALFSLYSNVPVYTSDTANKWCRIALFVSLGEWEASVHLIPKGTSLWSSNMEAGKTLTDIKLYSEDIYNDHDEIKTTLMGYTSVKNIKPQTQPENILSGLINGHPILTIALLHDFLKGFQFSQSKLGGYTVYQLDASLVYGPSAPLRLLLAFDGDKLLGVVHSRKLGQIQLKESPLHRGYIFSTLDQSDPMLINDFAHRFNAWIDLAD